MPQILRGRCQDCGEYNVPEKGFWDAGEVQPYCPTCKDFVFYTLEIVRKAARLDEGSDQRSQKALDCRRNEPPHLVSTPERS